MNGGAKDPLVDQPHVFLKGENMKKLTHLFFVVLTLLPFAATPVQTHAQETYTIKAEQHATTQVVPELPSISVSLSLPKNQIRTTQHWFL